MTFLVDTNALLRLHDRQAPERHLLQSLIHRQASIGNTAVLAAQVIFETWTVLTRELKGNGFGLDPGNAAAMLRQILETYPCPADPPQLVGHWLHLCESYAVRGRQGHDCRLVAWMELHGIKHLLTLNSADFARYPQVEALSLGL